MIYPINPKCTEVLGLPCYPNLQSVPGIVDHVIVSIPAESALSLLDECAAKGVKSVHVFTAGFSESGDSKRSELEGLMLRKARAKGFRILGPNCTGMLVPKSRLVSRSVMPLEPGRIAFLSQSGGFADDLPLFGAPRGLRFSKLVGYGNALDINESELLEYFAQDPDTGIIAAYIEGVRDGMRFIQALKKAAAARKPVVMLKGGTTVAGQRTARSHTSSLTSSAAVFNAIYRQFNIVKVDNIDEMIDALVAFSFTSTIPQGTGVAVTGVGGGPSVLASDEMEKVGLNLPPFTSEVQERLKQFLPVAGGIFINPVDSAKLTSPQAILETLCLLGRLPDIHTLVYHMGFHPMSRWGSGQMSTQSFLTDVLSAFKQVREITGKPVMLVLCPALDIAGMRDFLAAQEAFVKAGLPVFHSLRQAARAISRIVAWSQSAKSF